MKTALITGGTGAIGSALVREFSRDYTVFFTFNKNAEKAREIEKETGAEGIRCDVSSRADTEEVFRKIGGCDLLINNAGIAQIKLFTDITAEDWQNMLNVHLTGAFNFSQCALKGMLHKKSGAIINVSSVWGSVGASCEVHYSAVKAGLIGFTKALAKEMGPSGISVNCIAPGVIESPMNAHLTDDDMAELCDETPLGKIGKPSDVAKAARYLAEADFVTGQILGVDGGFGL